MAVLAKLRLPQGSQSPVDGLLYQAIQYGGDAQPQQLLMRALIDDLITIEHKDSIRPADL